MALLQFSIIWPCSDLFGLYGLRDEKRWRNMNFLLPIHLKKLKKLRKFGFFHLWPSFGLQIFFWPSHILNIQNHSNLSYFKAIFPLKQFLLKIWQSGSVCKNLGKIGGSTVAIDYC